MIKELFKGVSLPEGFDRELVEKAFLLAEKKHQGQKRKSGDPYISHPVATARIILELGIFDPYMVSAALLHDVLEDTQTEIGEIKEQLGQEVAVLVAAVTSLGKIDFSAYSKKSEAEEAYLSQKNENLRQLFLAMAEDVRVVIIKLADRLHNMRTVKALPKPDQARISIETLNIFSPLALRLGMGEIKGQLEDLAFPIAYPEEYKYLKKESNRRYKEADRYVIKIKRSISDALAKEGIKARIEGRSKHIYSLYKKITRPEINWDFEKIYDLVALRIITTGIPDCYHILGIIHSIFRPMPDYIRDYVAAPKPNGYRSIHTSVFGHDGKIIEIQIRTEAMHEEAEFGVASHMHYNLQKSVGGKSDADAEKGFFASNKQTAFLRQIKEWQTSIKTNEEFVEGLKIEFLDDRIYVFSPKGDIYDLPSGATPIDFAYEVHSKIGDSCRGAKVNGKIVSLETPLKTRDVVEIITAKNIVPKRGWLDFVKTSKARQHIRGYFRKFDFTRNLNEGKRIVEGELSILGLSAETLPEGKLKSALSATSFKSLDDLYASVGAGLTTPRQAIKVILGLTFIPMEIKRQQKSPKIVKEADFKSFKVQIAPCCHPQKWDKVICYITRGKGLTAHRSDCKNLKSLEPERLWEFNPWKKEKLATKIQILGTDRVGLIRDITNVISSHGVNIEKFKNIHPKGTNETKIEMIISVNDLSECSDLLKKISKVADVIGAKRV